MTTLSPTKARSNFIGLLKKAASGEEIGIRYGGKVFVLHPVTEEDTSYAEKEYGVTKAELKHFAERMDAKIKKNRKAGKFKVYNGNIEDLLKD
jgi:antitoxin (DNA-binding transcriptional repressor) of toxin-antitoxin stability system